MSFPARPAGAPLKQGASGDDVRLLQLSLRRLGYPLTGTGHFGPATDTAVAHFQARSRLASTGIVDGATAAAIAAAIAAAPDAESGAGEPPPLWLAVSLAHVGVTEGAGRRDNPDLVADIRTVAPDYQSDATPWCAGWVSFCLAKAGVKPSRAPLRALSYADGWGVRLRAPALGAVAVKRRRGGGHVTFVAGRTRGGLLACCGGNQNDMVNVAPYAATAFVGFYWPKDVPLPIRTGVATLPVVDARGSAVREA